MKPVVLVAFVATLFGCPPKPPVVNEPPKPTERQYCRAAKPVEQQDMCLKLFTPDGYACAQCRGREGAGPGDARGCVEPNTEVYCAAGTCFDDPACEYSDITR